MGHHHHHHHHEISGKNIGIAIILNILITIAEIIGGIITGSVSLLTEALHNFSDVLSLLLSFFSNKMAKKQADSKHTFGYKRAEIIATFINSATLIGIALYLIVEAVQRIFHPVPLASDLIIWFSAGSIVANVLSVLFLQKDAKHSMNMRSAYLHLLTDVMTSTAILIGAVLMKYFSVFWLDGVLSILIACYLIYSAYHLLSESAKILMDFVPEHINIEEITEQINRINQIRNVHHIHLRQLAENSVLFEAHIDVNNDIVITEFENILLEIEKVLEQYHIHHFTIQPEFSRKDDKKLIHIH
jgi:cobalt-zinc-cadmium efflux system protein